MKKNELTDLKAKTIDELRRRLSDLREEIIKLSAEKSRGILKNTNLIRHKQKDIARVLTILGMKAAVAKSSPQEDSGQAGEPKEVNING